LAAEPQGQNIVESTTTENLGFIWINLKGRVDSLSAPEIQRRLDDLILAGKRTLVANLQDINYVSSAGLRVFLLAQKQLKRVNGEIILFGLSENVARVFASGGLLDLFRVVQTEGEILSAMDTGASDYSTSSKDVDRVSFQYIERNAAHGSLLEIGSQEPFRQALYTERHVTAVQPRRSQFGIGLASLGDRYDEYKELFGESIIAAGHFFYYPSVKRPVADFMLHSGTDPSFEARFLHGFLFEGSFRYQLAFEQNDEFVQLPHLINSLFAISNAPLLGVVLLAESKGLWGMNLKRPPIREHTPVNGKDIFHADNFPGWFNFPVDPTDFNHVVVAVGIAVRDKDAAPPAIMNLLPQGNLFHLHGAVFTKQPLNRQPEHLETELQRVLTELDVSKVQHILGQSCFSSGMIGVTELAV
jgi:anti-anti-sigma factor